MPRNPHRVWTAALAALAFLASPLAARPAPAADDDTDVVVKKWLVLASVDVAARRPLRPDAVFAKHLLDRASAPPKDGDEIVGTLGKPAKWTPRAADEKGETDGDGIGWAYASVESPADRVVIARLEGAAALFVDGAGFTGDVYRLGDAGVPVALKKGANDVFVAGPRGGFRLTLRRIDASNELGLDGNRCVFPDKPLGAKETLPWSLRLCNLTTHSIAVDSHSPLVPLGVANWVCLPGVFGQTPPTPPPFELTKLAAPTAREFAPGEPYRRTFVSWIDGSVQSYALVPPTPSDIDKTKMGLVLSLHGAGVDCMDQARAYAPKPDFWIACPTNRGRYGFDWQDWGRLDAHEVLTLALMDAHVEQRRVYLTGHSMGGHGTWHLAANDPGCFLAIAPSAGWSGFDSYGGSQVMSPLAWMWRAADGASRTMDLVPNLAPIPTYVLHGEKDDNVPASEAHAMIDAITKAGGHPESHFEPDAGHWWDKNRAPGADCVDWPGIWELFRKTEPAAESPREVSFTTMDMSVDSGSEWIYLDQPVEYGRPSRINAKWDGNQAIAISTENVRRFRVSYGPWWVEVKSLTVTLDGRTFVLRGDVQDFERDGAGSWRQRVPPETRPPASQKESGRAGPFKRAFANRFVLVYGTAGDEAENRELIEKARCDSEIWAYRANGDAALVSDAQFLAGKNFDGRNVILYGNADTNKAWSAVFDDDCPIVAKRGSITVGGTKHEGVVAAAFVRPRKGSDAALAAAFADTGAAATRLFYCFPVFGSGFGIPDYVVFGPGFLKEMDGDVRAAGWFDYAWRMR